MREEKKSNRYINTLNEERMSKGYRRHAEDREYEELLEKVQSVKGLKESKLPKGVYPVCLTVPLTDGDEGLNGVSQRFKLHRYVRRSLVTVVAAAVMAVIYLVKGYAEVKSAPKQMVESIEVAGSRWQENGIEYTIYGNVNGKEPGEYAEGNTGKKRLLPDTKASRKPEVKVPVDMAVVENEQKSVDDGHSPWKLDATFVAQVFANLLISPEGIIGDYKIPYEDIEIVVNTGKEAIAKINFKDTLAEYIYMKRLVRQDDTGIWTVVGYDPVK